MTHRELHIDFETYSSVDLKTAGVHTYVSSPDFEVLICAYQLDGQPIKSFCPCLGDPWPWELIGALSDPNCTKWAHNVPFEVAVLRELGYEIRITEWRCTMILAAYCGLPMSLAALSGVLRIADAAKDTAGKRLINYYCVPCKPTKRNGGLYRNFPDRDDENWPGFVAYCEQDVRAEVAVHKKLKKYYDWMPAAEWQLYAVDQAINTRGVELDLNLARAALKLRAEQKKVLMGQMRQLTGLANPNSDAQLTGWLTERIGRPITSVAKEFIDPILDSTDDALVHRVLDLRRESKKTSTSKYSAMLKSAGPGNRARGMFQMNGAARTGRYAGRRIQLQNLPRNYLKDLDGARNDVMTLDLAEFTDKYPNVNDTLSQLIRTAIIAGEGKVLAIADYSAIEARVLAFLAGEQWRLDVFRTTGKIYEASASRTFGAPIEQITKDSPLRQQGKVTELASGYQGGVGAYRRMDFDNVLPEDDAEVKMMVDRWRADSPSIVSFWHELNRCALYATENPGRRVVVQNGGPVPMQMLRDSNALIVKLPSGRHLVYWGAHVGEGKYGPQVRYYGVDGQTGRWVIEDTYGGKLTENIVQAYARDLLTDALVRVEAKYPVVLHVHDELGVEVPEAQAEPVLADLEAMMSEAPAWAGDIPLKGEGFFTKYYKK